MKGECNGEGCGLLSVGKLLGAFTTIVDPALRLFSQFVRAEPSSCWLEPVQRSTWYCPPLVQSVSEEKANVSADSVVERAEEVCTTYCIAHSRPHSGNTFSAEVCRRSHTSAGCCCWLRWRGRWGRRSCRYLDHSLLALMICMMCECHAGWPLTSSDGFAVRAVAPSTIKRVVWTRRRAIVRPAEEGDLGV